MGQVKRLKLSMQYKQSQRAHESKKREKEFERLKQKLGQVLTSVVVVTAVTLLHVPTLPLQLVSAKNRDRSSGLSMLNTVQRTDGKRRVWTKPGRYIIQIAHSFMLKLLLEVQYVEVW